MARVGLMKKYIDLAKKMKASNIFKKAWQLQKAAKAKLKRKSKPKGVIKKTTTKKGVRKMAAKKKGGGSTKKRSPRRTVRLLSQTTMNALMGSMFIAVPALGGIWIINQIPWVKDQKAWMKALIQAGIGITGLTVLKGAMAKKLSSGIIAGGAMQLVFPYIPNLRFGAGRRLTPEELRSLQSAGRRRFAGAESWPGNRTGKPVEMVSGRGRNSNR